MTSMRRNDVASTSFRRHVPTRFLTNQCQIITFLILKPDIIENSRLELRGIVLLIIILPFYLIHFVILWFFPVSHRNWRKRWVDYWGGQRVCWPPLSNYWGGLAPPGPPSSYAYGLIMEVEQATEFWWSGWSKYHIEENATLLEVASTRPRGYKKKLHAQLSSAWIFCYS